MSARDTVQELLSQQSGEAVHVEHEITRRVSKLVDDVLDALDTSEAVSGLTAQLKMSLGMGALVSCLAAIANHGKMDPETVLSCVSLALDNLKRDARAAGRG